MFRIKFDYRIAEPGAYTMVCTKEEPEETSGIKEMKNSLQASAKVDNKPVIKETYTTSIESTNSNDKLISHIH